jgi:hypothetical protein
MTKTKTKPPEFLQAATPASEIGPWSQYGKQINELRKIAAAERNPTKRAHLQARLALAEVQYNGLLAKQSRTFPLGVGQVLTFGERLALRQLEQKMPDWIGVLMDTITAIVSSETTSNKRALLDQAFAEFTEVVLPDILGPVN